MNTNKKIASVLTMLILSTGSAYATISGSFPILLGGGTYSTTDISSGNFAINTGVFELSNPGLGNLSGLTAFEVINFTLPTNILVAGGADSSWSFTLGSGGVDGSFTAASLTPVAYVTSGGNVTDSFFVNGIFTGAGVTSVAGTTSASLSISLTQSGGAGQAISFSGTFANPTQVTNAPEPATIALMGLGLAGFAASRKKKQA